jgi:hypothetical protein
VIWTRPANSHTGRRQTIAASEAGQMAASDYAHGNPENSPCQEGGVHRWEADLRRLLRKLGIQPGRQVEEAPPHLLRVRVGALDGLEDLRGVMSDHAHALH